MHARTERLGEPGPESDDGQPGAPDGQATDLRSLEAAEAAKAAEGGASPGSGTQQAVVPPDSLVASRRERDAADQEVCGACVLAYATDLEPSASLASL